MEQKKRTNVDLAEVASDRGEGAMWIRKALFRLFEPLILRRYRIFLSYSSEHAKAAEHYYNFLLAAGHMTFLDTRNLKPGEPWKSQLHQGIRESSHFFLLWCAHAAKSPNVSDEVQEAIKLKKKIFPIAIGNYPLSEKLNEFHGLPGAPLKLCITEDSETEFSLQDAAEESATLLEAQWRTDVRRVHANQSIAAAVCLFISIPLFLYFVAPAVNTTQIAKDHLAPLAAPPRLFADRDRLLDKSVATIETTKNNPVSKPSKSVQTAFSEVPVKGSAQSVSNERLSRETMTAYSSAISALKRRNFERAIPDLRLAADRGVFLAKYYLARLYAMPGQSFTNHAGAFELLSRLVRENGNVDPALDNRAPFVARAELLLAYYYRHGVPELSLAANPALAKARLEHAALRLGDKDAQFELGRLDIEHPDTVARGLDTLVGLAIDHHHAPAAAEIAQVYAQGRLTQREPVLALAYAMLAYQIADGPQRLDMGDLYQTAYCRATDTNRTRATEYLKAHDQPIDFIIGAIATPGGPSKSGGVLDLAEVRAQRACSSGEVVPDIADPAKNLPSATTMVRSAAVSVAKTGKNGVPSVVTFTNPMGIGLRNLEQLSEINSAGEIDDSGETTGGEPGAPEN